MIHKSITNKRIVASGSNNYHGNGITPTTGSYTDVPFYVLFGQSNVGRSTTSSMNATESSYFAAGPITGAYIFNPGVSVTYFNVLDPGRNTYLFNLVNADEFGCEASLFKAFLSASSQERRLLKFGVGNTDMGTWNAGMTGNVALKNYIKQSVVAAKQNYKTLQLKAMIFMQGENDATRADSASAYGDHLVSMFNDLTSFWGSIIPQYGLTSASYTKVIGQINGISDPSETFRTTVRAAQAAYCSTASNNAILIVTDTYPTQSDGVHYNHSGQITFGNDIYQQIKNL